MWNLIKSAYLRIIYFIMKKSRSKDSITTRMASRKYILTILIFLAGTLLCGLPPILSVFVFHHQTALVILSGTEWVTVISMLCGFYFGANVAQKKLMEDSTDKPVENKEPEKPI